jgi:hypothetical protein
MASGARDTITKVVSRFSRSDRSPRASTHPVQPGHRCVSHAGSNIEVIDDELATTVEEIPETPLAIRAVEDIVLVDLHHGKTPSLGVHAVVVLELGFFVAEKRLALDEPVVPQHDRGMGDLALCVGHVI